MASFFETRTGTAVALLGGAVGTGIVIYALWNGRASDAPELRAAVEAAVASSADVVVEDAPKEVTVSQGDITISPVESDVAIETVVVDGQAEEAAEVEPEELVEAEPAVEDQDDAALDVASVAAEVAEDKPSEADADRDEVGADVEADAIEIETAAAPDVSSAAPLMPSQDGLVIQAIPGEREVPLLDADDPAVPKFDLVRVEADGSAVVAGRAAPNATVHIMSNGEEIGTATASGSGEFVALLDTDVQEEAQSIALIADNPDGEVIASQSNVIVFGRFIDDPEDETAQVALAPAVIETTDEEVRVIQPVIGLADLDRVSLDTISYDQAGQVVLAGRGRPGYVARVYADDTVMSEVKISGGGTWSTIIDDLDRGQYKVRVDEIDDFGQVATRAESPFQRIFPTAEQLELLSNAASVIVQPGNNLWRIAENRYGDGIRYSVIFEANKEQIRDPDLIYPGQVFELPGEVSE